VLPPGVGLDGHCLGLSVHGGHQVWLEWQEPEQEMLVPLLVIVMETVRPPYEPENARFFTPFTWSAGPTMVALVDGYPVPVATPLWQVEQLMPLRLMWVEWWPVLVVGML
jgi:hypothetical protein